MHQSATFSPAFAKASFYAKASDDKSAGRQSRNTHRSSTTLRMALQPSPSLPAGRQGYGRQAIEKAVSRRRLNEIWPSYLFTAPYDDLLRIGAAI